MILTILFYTLIGVLIWSVIWVTQFAHLMSLPSDVFPEPKDKTRWFIAFLTVFAVAPVAFFIWKTLVLNRRVTASGTSTRSEATND
ncbi:MAG: hypothetical protein NXI22_05670 [bacterium]|nr:hypothetical protein [bacterium]